MIDDDKPSSAEVVRMLESIDWDRFWQTVTEKSAPEIEAYRRASARYLETASSHVML